LNAFSFATLQRFHSKGVGIAAMDDGAAMRVGDDWLVITTDSHVIHPIFFPGGDIAVSPSAARSTTWP